MSAVFKDWAQVSRRKKAKQVFSHALLELEHLSFAGTADSTRDSVNTRIIYVYINALYVLKMLLDLPAF